MTNSRSNMRVFELIDQWINQASKEQLTNNTEEITGNLTNENPDCTKIVIAAFNTNVINLYIYDRYDILHIYACSGTRYTINANVMNQATECYVLNRQLIMYLYGAMRNHK